MPQIKISAAIIAKNEEKKIGNCLKSLKGFADEVIVVDGFSTDRTHEICAEYGAKVITHKFTGAFADDRNVGNDAAKNDWVLQLDADDILTEEFKKKTLETLGRNEGHVVYKFRRKNYFLGHPMDHGGFHHFIPNLLNRKAVKYEGVVHEVPVYNGTMGEINADIEHYPFDDIGQFVARQNRYTDIAALELVKTEGKLSEKEIKKNMINKSLKNFWKSYVKKQGYKEGFYGLVFAILFAFINFLKWAKYRELCYGKLNIK